MSYLGYQQWQVDEILGAEAITKLQNHKLGISFEVFCQNVAVEMYRASGRNDDSTRRLVEGTLQRARELWSSNLIGDQE